MDYKQNELILAHLRDVGGITQQEAAQRYGCTRLGARIYDLRHQGHDIRSETERGINRFGRTTHWTRYWLVETRE